MSDKYTKEAQAIYKKAQSIPKDKQEDSVYQEIVPWGLKQYTSSVRLRDAWMEDVYDARCRGLIKYIRKGISGR